MPSQKRHHFVPGFFLLRFADENERVLERPRVRKEFVTHVDNVAAECGFYDVTQPDGKKSKEVEDRLTQVEGDAAEVLRWIDTAMEAPPPGSHERGALSEYLGLQMSRTPEFREQTQFPLKVEAFLEGRVLTLDLMAEFREQIHLGFVPIDGEVQGAFDYTAILLQDRMLLTAEWSMGVMFQTAEKSAPFLADRFWCIEHDRKRRLVTSDTPLVVWRTPSPRDAYSGTGVADADEIRFPLDPSKQLVMTKRERPPSSRINPERSAACNQAMAFACHNFIVAHPSHQTRVAQLALPERRPILRFNSGPLLEGQPDGRSPQGGQVMHAWVPRR